MARIQNKVFDALRLTGKPGLVGAFDLIDQIEGSLTPHELKIAKHWLDSCTQEEKHAILWAFGGCRWS
jgi:hypothetical protein